MIELVFIMSALILGLIVGLLAGLCLLRDHYEIQFNKIMDILRTNCEFLEQIDDRTIDIISEVRRVK